MTPAPYALRTARYARHVSAPYVEFLERRGLALDIVRAAGAFVWDRDGRRYLDCIAGYGNLSVGHNHPRVLDAVVAELRSPRPYNWPYLSEAQTRLAEELARLAPGALDRSLIVSSGSEAVDSALKLVRLATGRHRVISARGAWHGFTLGALGVSEPSLCRSFAPLAEGVTHVPYGDLAALEQAMDERTGALILEPIQGDGGAVVPPAGYVREAAALCRRRNVVLILDEVKTGLGRTGRWFACEHERAVPDVLLLGKALGGGIVPVSAVVATREVLGVLHPGEHGSTFGGNPLAAAVGTAVIELLETGDFQRRAAELGEVLRAGLSALVGRGVVGFRARGLWAGVDVDPAIGTGREISERLMRKGFLVKDTHGSTIRLAPPLTITQEELESALTALEKVLTD